MTSALIFALLFLIAAPGQAEEHFIYKDPQGRLVLSNQQPPPGSNVLRKFDLSAFGETPMKQVEESSNMRSTGKSEASPKQDPKK